LPAPAPIVEFLGIDTLADVVWVRFATTNTKINDAGLRHLKPLSKLRRLELNGTNITDAGLVYLKRLSQLETLDLWETQVTDDGVKKLQQALPKCKIYY
jgi:hypothetical protein